MVSLGLVELVQGGVRSWHQEEKSPRASSSSPPLLPPPQKKGKQNIVSHSGAEELWSLALGGLSLFCSL